MTTATCCPVPTDTHAKASDLDILRCVGLAVSVAVILVIPAALSVLAFLEAIHG